MRVGLWTSVRTLAVSVTVAALGAATIATAGPAAAAPAGPRPDVDGDGRVDVVLGASKALAVVDGTGQKHVIAVPSTTDPINTVFGAVTATGDFNDDGYDDVAEADSWYDETAGAVWIYAGGPHGTLVGDGTIATVRLQQGLNGLPGQARSQVFFGHSLAAGDLTGDGIDDLAIGAMFQTVAGHELAGTVTFVPGSSSGLAPAKGRVLSQNSPGVPGVPEYNDKFGAALAIGDVTGDGRPDLAVGSAGENSDGMVQVLPGAKGGPTGRGTTSVTAGGLKIVAGANSVAEFGRTLALGDLTGDGRDDLVAAAPYARVGKVICGAVAVLRAAASGISPARSQVVSQSSPGVVGICETNDDWGQALLVADVRGDKRPELVVGAPVESIGELNGGGAYTVLRPSAAGVTGTGSFAISQNSPHVPGVAELRDNFGASLGAADLNRDGRLDIIAGASGEAVGNSRTGSVTFVISTAGGKPSAATTALSGRSFTPALTALAWSIAGPAAP